MNFAKRAEELSDQIIKDRRYLHQHPELSYKEKNTTAYLVASLKELGIPVCGKAVHGHRGASPGHL